MSATIETTITCDFPCGENCEGTFCDGDSRQEPANLQRAQFDAAGWHYYKGKDYCPNCWKRLNSKKVLRKGMKNGKLS